MEFLKVAVQILALYLLLVSILGTSNQIWNFVSPVTPLRAQEFTVNHCNNGTSCSNVTHQGRNTSVISNPANPQGVSSSSDWNQFRLYVELLYEYTFPVIIPIVSKGKNATNLPKSFTDQVLSRLSRTSETISSSTFVVTLLPSFFLIKGSFKVNYSNCKFWYYTQVGSLLLSCLKMLLITFLDLWDITTNGVLIAVLIGLSQLWLVQSFMERLEREEKNRRQNKFVSQLLALNDLDSFMIGASEEENGAHCDKSYAEVKLI